MATVKVKVDDTIQEFDSVLSQAQVAKFNKLSERLVFKGTTAYIRLEELHGVLFTKSRADACQMVLNHADLVKNYLVYDFPIPDEPATKGKKSKKKMSDPVEFGAIQPMGVYLLLEHLAEVNPKKAINYMAGLALLALILSNNPQIILKSIPAAKVMDEKIKAAVQAVKKQHSVCQLTGKPFLNGESKHAHHIECEALNPGLAAEPSNLVVIHEWVHTEYHDWASKNKLPVCRPTLGLYAIKKCFKTPFVESLKAC
jgi:hypothetical protein